MILSKHCEFCTPIYKCYLSTWGLQLEDTETKAHGPRPTNIRWPNDLKCSRTTSVIPTQPPHLSHRKKRKIPTNLLHLYPHTTDDGDWPPLYCLPTAFLDDSFVLPLPSASSRRSETGDQPALAEARWARGRRSSIPVTEKPKDALAEA
jgi:hypothetical protein